VKKRKTTAEEVRLLRRQVAVLRERVGEIERQVVLVRLDTEATRNILQRGLDKSLKPVEGHRSKRPDDAGSIRRAA
jgi:hypothetical protein